MATTKALLEQRYTACQQALDDANERIKELDEGAIWLERERLDCQDTIDDLLCGIRVWKDAKLAEADGSRWDNADEIVIRWVEARGLA